MRRALCERIRPSCHRSFPARNRYYPKKSGDVSRFLRCNSGARQQLSGSASVLEPLLAHGTGPREPVAVQIAAAARSQSAMRTGRRRLRELSRTGGRDKQRKKWTILGTVSLPQSNSLQKEIAQLGKR